MYTLATNSKMDIMFGKVLPSASALGIDNGSPHMYTLATNSKMNIMLRNMCYQLCTVYSV